MWIDRLYFWTFVTASSILLDSAHYKTPEVRNRIAIAPNKISVKFDKLVKSRISMAKKKAPPNHKIGEARKS